MEVSGAPARPLRVDAARNRARVLAAAAEVFAVRGLDVTLDDIAAHAGLGVGTVYRRFADREALVEALFDERIRRTIERMQAALDAPVEDAWETLIDTLRWTCEELAGDRGMRQVLFSSVHGHERVARCRDEIRVIIEQLVERAKTTGKLRPEFETSDVPMMLLMIGAVADFASSIAPDLWRRYFDMLVAGMRTPVGEGEDLAVIDGLAEVKEAICGRALRQDELISAMSCWRPAAR